MANVPTTSWSESSPAGTDDVSQGDNRIRELKTQVREVINVDHDFPSSGQAEDNGQHKKMTMQVQTDLGTGASGAAILGMQGTAGAAQLVLTTEGDSDIVVCNTTGINAPSITGVYSAANVASLATMMNLIYPVGTVLTFGVSTNPGTLLGVGTWTAITGKVIVGIAASGTFNTLDATGGAETVTLTSAEMPAHTHTVAVASNTDGNTLPAKSATTTGATTVTSNSTGDGGAHANLQPYIVKYVWQRTA